MLRNTTAVLAILLVIGSSGLSTSAHAGGGGHASGGVGFRDNHYSGSLSGLRNTSGSRYRSHANRASGSGGGFRGYGAVMYGWPTMDRWFPPFELGPSRQLRVATSAGHSIV
jgi:hypothetical protein